MLPIVAIVGRPNVGKSSLLNFLAGRRISIVDPTEGVTRDRVSTPIIVGNKAFELTDTGGYGVIDQFGGDDLTADIERQIRYAVDEAQLILFVVDTQAGLVPLDTKVAEFLRDKDKPVMLVANRPPSFMAWGSAIRCRSPARRGREKPSCWRRSSKS
jgi:GTP-binding protein